MTDQRMNLDLIHDILDMLGRHGYTRADDEHAGRAILLISDLAHISEGTQDHPFQAADASPGVASDPAREPQPAADREAGQ